MAGLPQTAALESAIIKLLERKPHGMPADLKRRLDQPGVKRFGLALDNLVGEDVITESNELSYYTKGPPPKRFAKQIPIEMLRIDDRFFFTTY